MDIVKILIFVLFSSLVDGSDKVQMVIDTVRNGIEGYRIGIKLLEEMQSSPKQISYEQIIKDVKEIIKHGIDSFKPSDKRLEELTGASKRIKIAYEMFEYSLHARNEESRKAYDFILKMELRKGKITLEADFILMLFDSVGGVDEPILDILEKTFKCNKKYFEQFKASFQEVCLKSVILKASDAYYLCKDQFSEEACVEIYKGFQNSNEKCQSAEEAISKRISECEDGKFKKYLEQHMKQEDSPHELGQIMTESFPYLWCVVTTINGTDPHSYYIKENSLVVKGSNAIMMYGWRNETLTERCIIRIKNAVLEVLNQTHCKHNTKFVHCYSDAVENALNTTGIEVYSLVGTFSEANINHDFNHEDSAAVAVYSDDWEVKYCDSMMCRINWFNFFGKLKTKEGIFRVFIHAKESDKEEEKRDSA